MQSPNHYSDEDFQQFLDNHFVGGKELFENHLRECSQCNEQFIAYSSVFSYLQTELEPAGLELSVAREVADRVFGSALSTSLVERVMYGLIAGLAVLAFGFCLRFFIDSSISFAPLAVVLALIGFHAFLSFLEVRLMRQKLSVS